MLAQGEGHSDPLRAAHAFHFSGEPEGDRLSPAGLREEWETKTKKKRGRDHGVQSGGSRGGASPLQSCPRGPRGLGRTGDQGPVRPALYGLSELKPPVLVVRSSVRFPTETVPPKRRPFWVTGERARPPGGVSMSLSPRHAGAGRESGLS